MILFSGVKIPEDVLVSIDECHPVMFPNIRLILMLLATLPVSNASAERIVSLLCEGMHVSIKRISLCFIKLM